MKRRLKRIIAIVLCLVLIFSFASCGKDLVTIPNIMGVDEASAKNVLSSNGLIPVVEYVYNDNVDEGCVTETAPVMGEQVEKNTQVKIYVSKGSSYIKSKDSRISWYNISFYEDDDWEFNNPYISEETLYIECYKVTFGEAITWNDRYKEGKIIGEASINDTFDKTVPVTAHYEKQEWKANESQSFTLEIPLSDLNENRPTTMYVRLFAYNSNNDFININISFSITW